MKKTILGTLLIGFGILAIEPVKAGFMTGWGVFDSPAIHANPYTCEEAVMNSPLTMWFDPGMIAATGLDWLAEKEHGKKTIDAKDAIKKLEEALKSDSTASSGSQGAASPSTSAAYAPAQVLTVVETTLGLSTNEKDATLFGALRDVVKEYLFESSSPDILEGCTYQGDERNKNCAAERQVSWLLTSVAMASATADKILANEGSKAGHFQGLASQFNAQKSPKAMYGAVAAIVLDTHTQMNEANALLARDLEAQSLRTVYESGVVSVIGE